jgi:hypothetical protein
MQAAQRIRCKCCQGRRAGGEDAECALDHWTCVGGHCRGTRRGLGCGGVTRVASTQTDQSTVTLRREVASTRSPSSLGFSPLHPAWSCLHDARTCFGDAACQEHAVVDTIESVAPIGRLLEGDVRLADANPGIGRGWAPNGRQRSASEPTDGASAAASAQTNGPVHTPARTASAGSELPVSVDSEVQSRLLCTT